MRVFDPGSPLALKLEILLIQFFVNIFLLSSPVDGRIQEHEIHWNTSNPLFSSPDPDGYDSYTVRILYGDTLKFFCPNNRNEHLVVYLVDEMSFMNCLISSSGKEQLRCDGSKGPRKQKLIRSHSPFPEATRFEPGVSYYFISTSTGTSTGLESRHNGLCATNQMRLRVEIDESPSNPPPTLPSPTLIGYQEHPRAKISSHKTENSEENFIQLSENVDERRLSKDAPFPHGPSSITEEKMQQVIAWAQRGLEGTFRFQDQGDQKSGSNVGLNRLDGNAEAYYVVNEDAAPYSSISTSIPITAPLLFTFFTSIWLFH